MIDGSLRGGFSVSGAIGQQESLRRRRERGKVWYRKNRERHLEQSRARHSIRRDAIRAFVLDHLLLHPCVDCGESDPIVLDFDHTRDKSFNIASAVPKLVSIDRLKTEIGKCVVRCANCHRRKTHKTLGYQSRQTGEPASLSRPLSRRVSTIARGENL